LQSLAFPMQSNLFVILSFISLFVLSGAVTTTPTNEYGPIPQTFCDPVDYLDLTLTGSDVIPVGSTSGFAGSFPFTLTDNAPNQVGALWYNIPINLYNGFVTIFTLSFDPDESCQSATVNGGQGQRCGGEGIAFVIQQDGTDAIGGSGSGMGYAGINNVVAVEFDTMYDAQTNDPSTPLERHISIIIKKGAADANEVNSYGFNSQPLNFKDNTSENYISSPTVRIEYLNNNLRVFINDVLQLAYYNPLNLIKNVFQTTNPLFHIGFTASTSTVLAQKQLVEYWEVLTVQSDADHSSATVITPASKIVAGQNFDVLVTIRDRCANFFATSNLTNLVPSGFGDFNQTCKVVQTQVVSADLFAQQYNFLVTFNCTLNKENFVNFKWFNDGAQSFRDLQAQPTSVTINAAPLASASIIWTDFGYLIASNGQSPSTDANTPLRFTVIPKDAFGNEVSVDQTFINSITVSWPDKTTKSAKVTGPVYSGNRLTFTVNVDAAGTYTISSPWFATAFTFYVKPGVVSAASSIAYLGDANGNKFTLPSIKAGTTDVYLYLILRDSANNLIPVNITDIDNQVDGYGVDWNKRVLNNSYVVLNDAWGNSTILQNNTIFVSSGVGVAQYKVTPYRAGTNVFQAWVRGVQVPFQPNSITVTPGDFCSTCPNAWQYVEVWPWNIQTNAFYSPSTPQSIIVYRQGLFKALVITTDVYFNPIYQTTSYTLTLAGELMYPITMCGSPYNSLGSAHTICATSGREVDNYNSLVQRSNYTLYVNDTSGNVVRAIQVYLVSFADDSASGNGPWVPEKTITWNWYIDGRTSVRCTNSFSDTLDSIAVGLSLRNPENKQTNRWFVQTQNIRLNTSIVDKTKEQFIVRTTCWTGIYIVYYITQRPEYLSNGRKIEIVIDKSEIYAATGLGLWPDDPVQYNIIHSNRRLLASGTATQDFTTSTPVDFIIYPQYPLYGYLVDTLGNQITNKIINPFGNYTSGYNVDNTLTFNIAIYDVFGNPSWYEAPNWFRVASNLTIVQFQSSFDAYVLAPQCNPTTVVGFYNCTMKAIKAGYYIITSPIFLSAYTGLSFTQYEVYIAPGQPTVAASFAELDLSTQTYFLATQSVNFYITPRDQYLNLLPPNQTIYDGWFKLLYQLPNNVSYTATDVVPVADAVTGRRILFITQVNMSGITFFKPTLSGTPLSCAYCSVTVKPNVPDWTGSTMKVLIGGSWILFDPTVPLQLDNFNKIPSFYLQITDIAGNLIGQIPAGWQNFVANLNHPRFQNFTLNGLPYLDGVQFTLDSIYVANYSDIVWSNQWSLSFNAWDANQGKTVSIYVNNVTTLGQGSANDSIYDSGNIDVTQSDVTPYTVTVVAGTVGSFIVETRTSVGKLKKYFYPNGIAGNIVLSNVWFFQTYNMSRGTSYGTYVVSFNITGAGTYSLNVKITNDAGQLVAISKVVTIIVTAASVYTIDFQNRTGLVLNSTNLYPKTIDDTISFTLLAYDFWRNPIYSVQPKALGLSFTNPNNANAQYSFTVKKGLGAGFAVQLIPKTVGNYLYSHTDLTQNGGALSLILPIAVGNPVPTASVAEVLVNKLKPTDNAWIYLTPTDAYQNPVPPSIVNQRFPGKNFKAQIQYPGTNGSVSNGAIYYLGIGDYDTTNPNATSFYWSALNLTQAGTYTFTTYFDDISQQTKYTSRVVTVEATNADFFSLKLNVKDPKTQTWSAIPRVDDPSLVGTAPQPIQWDPVSKPAFQLDLLDVYGNQISSVPSNWNLTLKLISVNDTMAEPIYFCYDGSITFYFCAKNESQQPEFGTDPNVLWAELVTTDFYHIELNNGQYIYDANWTFVPNPSDEGASDNPLDITKTVISPQSVYTTTAGQAISFNVELRTTDNLRKNVYLDNPSSNISVIFAQDNDGTSITYKVSQGQLLGQYVITLTPFKTYPNTAPNQITFLFNQQMYTGFQPYLVSTPAKPSDIFAVGFYGTENSQIGSSTVDYIFSFTIQGVDIYNNTVPLATTDAASVKVTDPNGQAVSVTTYVLQSTYITASFQPQVVGTYNVNVDQRHNYTVVFTNGVPSSDVSTFTVRNQVQTAGNVNQLIATIFDQFGNSVPLTLEITNNFTGFFNLQNSLDLYVIFSPIFSGNVVIYEVALNTSGVYDFTFAYKNKEAVCKSCSAIVNPGAVSFANSSFQYYSPQASGFVTFNPLKPEVENNLNTLPLYSVVLRDAFGNALTSTPQGYTINATLTGGDNATVSFNTTIRSDGTLVFDLPVTPITVGGVTYNDTSDYWSALLYSNSSYTLSFTDGSNTYNQSIIIQGDGASDLDASNLDFSITNTIISTNSLVTTAHQYVSFTIETRTIDNKRKANFLNANITVTFAITDPSDNYTVISSDQGGVYVVSVITDKAYSAQDNQQITFSVNGSAYATPISLVVNPGTLYYAQIVEATNGSLATINATLETTFNVIGTDEYGNTISGVPANFVNLQIYVKNAPENRANVTFSFAQTNNSVLYTVDATYAGSYLITSPMFKDPEYYEYLITPALGYALNSVLSISYGTDLPLSANVSVQIVASVYDQFNNLLLGSDVDYSSFNFTLVGSTGTSYLCTPTSVSFWNFVNCTIYPTVADNYVLSAEIYGVAIPHSGLAITIAPSTIDISQTTFFKDVSVGLSVAVTNYSVAYGSTGFQLEARFRDYWGNSIQQFDDTDTFNIQLLGNNMNAITLVETRLADSIISFSVSDSDAPWFERLANASNYTILALYSRDGIQRGNASLPFSIDGIPSDAGNGNYDLYFTNVQPFTINTVAGFIANFTIELRTPQGQRYNGPIADDAVVVSSVNGDNSSITFTTNFTGTNGIWVCTINSTKSFSLGDQKFLSITVEGNVIPNIQPQLVVLPDFPQTFTLISTNFTGSAIPENIPQYITFRLFDEYGNQYTDSSIASRITPYSSTGNVDFGTLTQSGPNFGDYNLNFVPYFPPLVTLIDIHLAVPGSDPSQNAIKSVLGNPFQFNVTSSIDPPSTDIVGTSYLGIQVDQEMDFIVLVRNKKLYCYPGDANVSVIFTGPYSSYTVNDQTLSASQFFNFSANVSVVSLNDNEVIGSNPYTAQTCTKYYSVQVPAGSLQKAGIYQMQVSVNQWTPIVVRQTVMRAGQISIPNTAAFIPTGYGNPAYGKTPISIVAASTFSFQIQLYDQFDNIITYDNGIVPAGFAFNDSSITSDDYSVAIQNNRNGSYSVVVNVTLEGIFNQFLFSINYIIVDPSNMFRTGKLNNFPNYIQVTPGYCSNLYPVTPVFTQFGGVILVGVPNSFYLQCTDQFDNLINVTKSEAQFSVVTTGSNLDTVGSDRFYPTVTPVSGGLYEVSFTVAWSGNYSFRIQLRQAPYLTVSYTAQYSLCPTSTPYFCSNVTATNQSGCTTGPLQCSFPGITFSGDSSKPFVCADGTNVSALQQCSCPSGQIQSPVTGLCATPTLSALYFPTVAQITCSTGEVKCSDGSCRSSTANCPALRTCAPGYYLCPDLTCAGTQNECTSQFSTCPPAGNTVYIFKCWDQSCAASIDSCPSRVTCPVAGQVFCEGVCVDNALECQLPTQCSGTTSLRCSDGSCANKTSDCPSPKTCGSSQALCYDGSCRDDCGVTTTPSRLRRRVLDANSNVSIYTQFVCPSGDVVPSVYNCPSAHVCGLNKIQCVDGSCVNDLSQCADRICPAGTVECWDGKCETSLSRCSTRTTCPDELPTLCPDGSCQSSSDNCADYVECPVYFPFRCGSGDCRTSGDDCPTLIVCPPEMPIKCQDQSCVRSKLHCSDAAASVCSDGTYRCPDGSCAASKSLCPTTASCPTGQIRCWSNDCQNDTSLCPPVVNDTVVCPTSAPIRCADSSCRNQSADCPTAIICPIEQPVLCDDGNCRDSINNCFANSGCTFGTKRCPDGSCVGATDTCGTPITCPSQAPYRCFDMTCKQNPLDCPSTAECPSDSPIRCGDGTCVTGRIYCRSLSPCPANTPVQCPDLISCVSSRDQCPVIQNCPAGFTQCDDGSCSISQLTCPTTSCPVHLSFKCPDGFCVADQQFCSDTTTGCPYNAPTKCPDGSCKALTDTCGPTPNCTGGQSLCLDGSCSQSCTGLNKVGCSNGQIKCTNGQCIDPTINECPVASCPTERPAKCLDGQCVTSLSNCPSTITKEDFGFCNGSTLGNFVPCADGTCVASAEQCRPILPCQALFVRCNDGSCRPTSDQCPQVSTCPSSRSYRCPSGVCAPSIDLCPSDADGCPARFGRRCQKTGQCISNNTEDVLSSLNITRSSLIDPSYCNGTDCSFCNNVTDDQIQQAKLGLADQIYLNCTITEDICNIIYSFTNLSNGCNFLNPFKCSNNSCVSSLSQCGVANNCPAGQFLCLDNTCAVSADICRNKSYDCSMNATYAFQCPDNKCAQDPRDCLTKDGCPVSTPYKCSDGNCYNAPVNKSGESGCTATIQCPAYKPFVCSDGECVGDSSFCQIELPCPAGKVRCTDRSCADSSSQCNTQLCPPKRPILCSTGSCVEKAIECQEGSNICSSLKPFRCAVGVCVSAPSKCDMFTAASNSSPSMRRILARLLQDNTTSNNTDPGCTTSAPYKCYDGSCRSVQQNCPILPACSDPANPYRCSDGSCAASKRSCSVQSVVCQNGLQLCTDGICRIPGNCPAYNGCPLNKPLQCGNGYCASNLAECAGHSDCPAVTPFRCANNLCVSDMTQCNISVRSYTSEDMAITVSPITTTTFNFITEPGTAKTHASLIIPSGALLPPVDSNSGNASNFAQNSVLNIKPVAQSALAGLLNPIDETRIDYTSDVFALSDGNLSFYQTVRSSVFSINSTDNVPYRFPMYITIDYEPVTSDTTDYCIGQANLATGVWNCLRANSVSNGSTTFTFNLTTDGIYAVIFNPERRDAALIAAIPTWWDQYKGQFFLWGGVTLICLAIFSYVFWRMMRYVAKYRGSKKTMKNFEAQIKELQTQNTDILGQSLRDKVEGIVFVVNPMHEKHEKPDLSADIKEMEKALNKLEERDKQLEADNQSLLNRNKVLEKELSKLKEQFAQ